MPSQAILLEKKEFVSQLRTRIMDASAGVLVDYKGISVEQDTALRRELREAGVDYRVVKNTMMHLAVQDTPYEEIDNVLSGTTALALCGAEDPLAAARVLSKFVEKSKGKFSLKLGYMDGKVITADEVNALAKLPGREGLLAMLLSALTGNLRGLAVAIKAVADKREQGGETASTAVEEAKEETKAAAEEAKEKTKAEEKEEPKEDAKEDAKEETAEPAKAE